MAPALTAQQTVERARALLESGRGAAVPELLNLIERLSTDISRASIGELAELIEKDGVVLTRIFSIANRLPHNPGISPVATLSQAIHQIGYNRIRSAVVSLLLLDNTGSQNPPEQRDAAALALTAGLIAGGTAEVAGTHDSELVFACATLRNLGRILMATLSPEHYREAIELTQREPRTDGFRRRFGVTVVELSRRVLASSKLPDDVLKSLRDCEPESLNGVSTNHEARLLAFSDFGSRLAALTLDPGQPDDGFVQHVKALSRRFHRLIPDAETIAKPAMLRANERLRSFARCSGVSGLPYPGLRRIRHRLEVISPGAAAAAEKAEELPVRFTAAGLPDVLASHHEPGPTTAEAPALESPAPSSENPSEPAPTATGEITASATAAATTDDTAPTLTAENWDAELTATTSLFLQPAEPPATSPTAEMLAFATDAVGANEAWLFRVAPPNTTLRLEAGIGPAWSHVRECIEIAAQERSVFGICLHRREVVLIHDTSDPALARYLPPWWQHVHHQLRAFSLIPVLGSAGSVDALLLVGWSEARQVQLTQPQVRLLRQLVVSPAGAPTASHAA